MDLKFFSSVLIILQVLSSVFSYEANCDCSQEIVVDPHCASDGVAYPTLCHLKCAQRRNRHLRFVSKSVCPIPNQNCADLDCPFDDFVCASNGHEYLGNCTMKCAQRTYPQLRFVHNGRCQRGPPPSEISCDCPVAPASPICGTGGPFTYAGLCGFECAQKINPDLKLWRNERCITNPGPIPPGFSTTSTVAPQ